MKQRQLRLMLAALAIILGTPGCLSLTYQLNTAAENALYKSTGGSRFCPQVEGNLFWTEYAFQAYRPPCTDNGIISTLGGTYFAELFIYQNESNSGVTTIRELATRRIVADPIVYFVGGEDYPEEKAAIQKVITTVIPALTGNQYKAIFSDQISLNADGTVPDGTASAPLFSVLLESGSTSYGSSKYGKDGIITTLQILVALPLGVDDFTIAHEMMHAIGNSGHSGTCSSTLTHNFCEPLASVQHPSTFENPPRDMTIRDVIQAYEKEAFALMHALPPNTTLKELLDQGILTTEMVNPSPLLIQANAVRRNKLDYEESTDEALGSSFVRSELLNQGRPGDTIKLVGERLIHRWKCDKILHDDTWPTVSFNGVPGIVRKITSRDSNGTALITDSSCGTLMVDVPDGATSGPLTVTSVEGGTSNAIQFTVTE